MCTQNLFHHNSLKLTEEQAAKIRALQEANKQAAREQLLRIQLLISRRPK